MTDPRQRRLVLCSGAQVPPGSPLRVDRKIVEVDALDSKSNVHIRLENVTNAFAQKLPARFVDLLELATYVYCADCEASRGPGWLDDGSTERWDRDFHFVMPVRDLSFWTEQSVQGHLVESLEFLSGDHFTFDFLQLERERPVQEYLRIVEIQDEPFYQAERVVMFSGGLDSLAGAVESAALGKPLVLVSHRPVVQTNSRQRELFKLLQKRFPVEMMHVPVWVNKTRLDREPTQRTRSFLYSALGVAVAQALEAGGVRFYENGVVSLNWPLAGEILRTRASRTTHPLAMHYLERLYRLLIGRDDFVIDNPYVCKTKAEVLLAIRDHGSADLIKETCSCTHTMFQTRNQWHCGRCGQCIDRRVAMLASGLDACDPEEDYVNDVFTGARRTIYDHNIAHDYALSAGDLGGMHENDIGKTYSLELSRAVRPFDDRSEYADRFIRMQKQHSASVCRVLADQVRLHANEFVSRSIEPSSLVAMVGRQMERWPAPGSDDVGQLILGLGAPAHLFRNMGEYWIAAYEGRSVLLQNHKGIRYIAILLQHQGQELEALQLLWMVDKRMPVGDPVYSKLSGAELAEHGLQVGGLGDSGPIMDADYEADVRRRLGELQEKCDLAEAMRDAEAAAHAEEDMHDYLRVLSEGIGLGGRHRKTGSASERTRIATKQAIDRALRRIQKVHSQLYYHLHSAIQTGTTCCYRPVALVDWEF